MSNLRTGIGAAVATIALTSGGIAMAAGADASKPAPKPTGPCAKEQAQVNKAQAKLDALTLKFAKKKAHVKKDKKVIEHTHGSARAHARHELKVDKVAKARVKKAKKAQVQRLAHATARLNKCLGTTTPAPSSSSAPTGSTSPSTTASTSTSPSTTPSA